MSVERETIDLVVKHEGMTLNSNEPASVGGKSFAGISQKTWELFLSRRQDPPTAQKPPLQVDDLERSSNHPFIYEFYEWYADGYHVGEVHPCLQYIFYDLAVMAGSGAVRILQEMAGCEADGKWGRGTSAAVKSMNEQLDAALETDPSADNRAIMIFHEKKMAFFEALCVKYPDRQKYLKGWTNRALQVLETLRPLYFEDEEENVKAFDDDDGHLLEEQVADESGELTASGVNARLDAMEAQMSDILVAVQLLAEKLAD